MNYGGKEMSEWNCGSLEPIPGVPRVRILDETGRKLFEGYYIYRVNRQLCPFGDRLSQEDVDHMVAVVHEADWNLERRMTIKKVTPPHRIELIEPQERTCRIYDTDHGFEDSIRCDACQMTFRRPWQPFKFCPNCGARVIQE